MRRYPTRARPLPDRRPSSFRKTSAVRRSSRLAIVVLRLAVRFRGAPGDPRGELGLPAKLGIQLVLDLGDQMRPMKVILIAPLGGPERGGVPAGQAGSLVGEACPDACVGMVLVPLPAPQRGPDDADDARTVQLEVPAERSQQEFPFLPIANVRVPEIKSQLPVNIRHREFVDIQHRALGHLGGVKRRSGDRRVEHELMKVGVVRNCMIDHLIDVLGRVLLQADDAGTEHVDPIELKRANQCDRVGLGQLGILRVLAFQAKPDPVDAEGNQLFDRVVL